MPRDYHSANLPPAEGLTTAQHWTAPDGSLAFVYDVLNGKLPPEYDRCDVLYADLPWRSGFKVFNDRADISDGRTYHDFMAAVSKIVAQGNRPIILVTGRHALPLLPPPTQTSAVQMPGTGQDALAIFYNLVTSTDWMAIYGLLRQLARVYECVGDFCCGYGNAARVFAQHGKRYIVSDVNPQCIGYIAANAGSWVFTDA